jgi:riboflavin kinase/FMN adenylyltransferase
MDVAATIGFFDGVHLGHQHLLATLCQLARERGLQSCVVTFAQHPRQVLCPDWRPSLLTTADEKEQLLADTGVERIEMLTFTREMAALTARQFMEQILSNQLNTRLLLTGYDNRFGHNRAETFDDYVTYGRDLGIDVVPATQLRLTPARSALKDTPSPEEACHPSAANLQPSPNSTLIRQLIAEGNVSDAAQLLGRCYSLTAQVVGGFQIGRQLGFPTANLRPLSAEKLIPGRGVYAVKVGIDGTQSMLTGMMNIGTRPTFSGHDTSLEVHLLHFSEQLYGHKLTVQFVKRLREERRFDSPEQLAEQLAKDAQQAALIVPVL